MNELEIKINDITITKIINIPSPSEYYNRASEIFSDCLFIISELLLYSGSYDIYQFNEYDKQKKAIELVTKLQQATEIFLSGIIISKDPTKLIKSNLLIEKNNKVEFDSLVTVTSENLIELAYELNGKAYFSLPFNDINFKNIFNAHRRIRNKNMHSLVKDFVFDLKEFVINFISIWFIFFKKKNFVADIYKRIISYDHEIKKDGTPVDEMDESYIEEIAENPLLFAHYMKLQNRRFLFKIMREIKDIIDKNKFKILINYDNLLRSCICPNCESISRTMFSEGKLDYEDYFDRDFQKPCNSLIEVKKNKLSKCYICGLKIKSNNMYKKICNHCNKETFFYNTSIKMFKIKDKKNNQLVIPFKDDYRIHQFCLNCGNIEKHPFDNELNWIY